MFDPLDGMTSVPPFPMPPDNAVVTNQNQPKISRFLRETREGAWSVTVDGAIVLYLNPAMEQLLGRPSHLFDAHADLWLETVCVRERERVKQWLFEVVEAAGQTCELEYTIELPDGADRSLRSRAWLCVSGTGDRWIEGLSTEGSDDGESGNTRFERLTANLPGVVYRYVLRADGSDCFTYLSSGCYDLCGVPADMVRRDARIVWQLVHPKDLEPLELSVLQSAQTLNQWTYEWRINLGSRVRWIAGVAQPERQANGDITWDGIFLDITPRKQAEIVLQQTSIDAERSHRLLSSVIDSSPDCIFAKDEHFRYIFANQSTSKLFGLSVSELLGKTDLEIGLSEDFIFGNAELGTQGLRGDDELVLQGRAISNPSEVMTDVNGNLRVFDTRKMPLRNEQSSVYGILTCARDMTERHHADAQVREMTRRLQEAQHLAQFANWEYLPRSEEMIWSPEHFRIFGLPPEGKTPTFSEILQLIHVKDRQRWRQAFERALEFGTSIDLDYSIVRPSGELRYVSGKGQVEFDRDGHVVRLFGTVLDMTERVRAEADRDRFFSMSLDPLGILDFEGQFKRCNPAWEDRLGYSESEMAGRSIHDFLSSGDQQTSRTILEQLRSGEPIVGWETRCKTKSGEYRWFSWNAAPIVAEKTIYAIARDISERKAAEVTLRQSEQKYRLLAQQEELINRIAQQIRNSLDLDTILQTAVTAVRELLQADRCNFFWYIPPDVSPSSNILDLANSSNRDHGDEPSDNPPADRSQPLSQGYFALIAEAKYDTASSRLGRYPIDDTTKPLADYVVNLKGLRIDDLETFEDNLELRSLLETFGHRSVLLLPFKTESGEIGTLSCTNDTEAHHWETRDLAILNAVCDRLSIAISQAALYQKSRDAERHARARSEDLTEALRKLQAAQSQLVQAEKMSSLGQLVAGVAHEINNPTSFIYGNVTHATQYTQDLFKLIALYEQHYPEPAAEILTCRDEIELEYLIDDLPQLLHSMEIGAERIADIVKSLRTFSRLDESARKRVDLHANIDATLTILQSRLRATADHPEITIVRQYGDLPPINCYIGPLNQVFMNLIANAIDAIESQLSRDRSLGKTDTTGQIEIATSIDSDCVTITVTDNGGGIPDHVRERIFDPFYTTKQIGKGTGLGLSICYQIVVDRHNGQLSCHSTPDIGTTFTITFPTPPI
jgi:two-component system NtrC family sensor kinase